MKSFPAFTNLFIASVLMFMALQSSAQTGEKTFVVLFETSTLYLEKPGLVTLDSVQAELRSSVNEISQVILEPFYCLKENEDNAFIGVNRAKVIQGDIETHNSRLCRKILIRDLGSIDEVMTNKCLVLTFGHLPSRSLDTCRSGLLVRIIYKHEQVAHHAR